MYLRGTIEGVVTMRQYWWVRVGVLLGLVCLGVIPPAYAESRLPVTVSIAPQEYFVHQIGGSQVQVTVMVPPGAEPASYEPKPQQVVALAAAKIYFAVGVPFERAWLKKFRAANPAMLIVHTEAGIAKRSMDQQLPLEMKPKAGDLELPPQGEHSREGVKDPHVWLSPPLVMIQARNILAALVQVDPARKEFYEANYEHFITQLVELDMKIGNIFWGPKPFKRKPFIVFHPAWGYFAAAYGLQQIPVQLEGKEPKAQQLQKLIAYAQTEGIKAVFVQPEFSTRSARTIAQSIGGRIVVADPLAKDWAKNLLAVAQEMAGATQ